MLSDGTVGNQSGEIVAEREHAGVYEPAFPTDISHCAATADNAQLPDGPGGTTSAQLGPAIIGHDGAGGLITLPGTRQCRLRPDRKAADRVQCERAAGRGLAVLDSRVLLKWDR